MTRATSKITYTLEEFIEPTEPDTHQDKRLIVIDSVVVASMLRNSKDFRANMSLEGGDGYSYDPTPREAEMALNAAEVIGLGYRESNQRERSARYRRTGNSWRPNTGTSLSKAVAEELDKYRDSFIIEK